MGVRELINSKIDVNRQVELVGGFGQDMQVLFLVDDGFVTPKLLMQKMGILKTNLSLICAKLIKGGYLSKMSSDDNKKLVAYCLTTKGKHLLTKKLKDMESNENI